MYQNLLNDYHNHGVGGDKHDEDNEDEDGGSGDVGKV